MAVDVHTLSMVYNEADRYWRDGLQAWSDFSDSIVVLDDGSTDETMPIARSEVPELLVEVETYDDSGEAWGNESKYRQRLFEFAWKNAEVGDVLFVLDADMTPARNPRPIFEREEFDAFAFRLYDLWRRNRMNEWGGRKAGLLYREDELWNAHHVPRIWAVRKTEQELPEWSSKRGIHSGHLPDGWEAEQPCVMPRGYSLLHFGYLHQTDRSEKIDRYMSVADQLSDHELLHAESITDPNPNLEPLDIDPEYDLERADRPDMEVLMKEAFQ